ncbi:unnamed protein product [Symbiodinium natans]|uniref:Ubiquitin-like domain-containing protein n=1 Tax=Symbiodinium natans TaxID=878477 RepID=A0A812ICH9_9DINO|nr:unnamed protein product [Symbiodinium natans]
MALRISMRLLSGAALTELEVAPGMRVEELKREMQRWNPCEDEVMRRLTAVDLVFGDRKLEDDLETVQEVGLLQGAEVHVVFRHVPAVTCAHQDEARCDARSLIFVHIPPGVRKLRPGAFQNCGSLVTGGYVLQHGCGGNVVNTKSTDMLDVPGGKFQVDFSSTPQPVRAGDYLATGYPEATEVFLSRNAEQIYLSQIIRSQDEMCRHFLPIIRKCGTVVRRIGWRVARPAMRGEEVLTIVDGEEIAKAVVEDDKSMVIMADTTDREWYVLDSTSFDASYERPGVDIGDESPDAKVLRDRGFKRFKRRGMARMYQVSEGDLTFLPSRKFFCKGTSFPLLLRAGDFLVTGYPDATEIYLSRHGEEVFEHVSPHELIRSQEEMCERFGPILLQRGVRVPRAGYTMARPAKVGEVIRTLIDGELVAKVEASPGSMVLRLETTDRELQVLTESEFAEDHCLPAEPWEDASPEVQVLQKRGFKRYRQKGTALLYQVTQEDMEDFVPGGRFQIPGGLIPSNLRAGDYLEARHPYPRWVRMNRNAGQVYRTEMRRASVVEEAVPREPETLLLSSMLPSRIMQFRSQASHLGSQSTQCMEPEGPKRGEIRTPITMDRAYSAPNSSRPEGLAESQGSVGSSSDRTNFVDRLRSEISGVQELRVLGALEEGLRAAAKQQVALVRRWYDGTTQEERGRPASAHVRGGTAAAEASEAELAIASWLSCLPAGVRGLLVLTDAAEVLTRDAPRRLLERLLNRHKGLHLLVTLVKKPGEELPHIRAFKNVEQYDGKWLAFSEASLHLQRMEPQSSESLLHQVRSSLISEELGLRIAAYSLAAQGSCLASGGPTPAQGQLSPCLLQEAPLSSPKSCSETVQHQEEQGVGKDQPEVDAESMLNEVTPKRLFESPADRSHLRDRHAKHLTQVAQIFSWSKDRVSRAPSDHPPSPSETVASSVATSLRSRRYRSGTPLSSQQMEILESYAGQQQLHELRQMNHRSLRKALAGVGQMVPTASVKALTTASGPVLVTPERRRPPRVAMTPEKDHWDDRTSCTRTFDGQPIRSLRQITK